MSEPPADTAAIWQALTAISDPEFGINIVDLGLIYSVECAEGVARVVMTLTTPTCPSGGWICEGVRHTLEGLPGIRQAEVELVFDPPWSPEMLSEQARCDLGR